MAFPAVKVTGLTFMGMATWQLKTHGWSVAADSISHVLGVGPVHCSVDFQAVGPCEVRGFLIAV